MNQLDQYAENLRELLAEQRQAARDEARRRRDMEVASATAQVLSSLAMYSSIAAVTVKDPKMAAEFMGDTARYQVAASLAFLGPDAVLQFLDELKP